jgi:uncharacterized protein (DUF2062 family)/2-polyprenyl-3-methyl-5-hydroxy-6-metoxy-1,4-benzoquinol methylase
VRAPPPEKPENEEPRDAPAPSAGEAGAWEDTPRRRTRLGRSLADLHVRLRTEGDTPPRHGAAIALGTFLGCTPLLGLHLLLCTVLARLFGLNRIVTYLAAHINNPLSFPFLLWAEATIGHWVFEGHAPHLSLAQLRESGLLGLGRDVLAGSAVLGAVLGTVFGLVAWQLSLWRRPGAFAVMREAAAEPYLEVGLRHWEIVRGKLRWDPMYRGLLEIGLLPRPGRLVDLGCGRGILLSLLAAVADADLEPPGSPDAVPEMELVGIELRRRLVRTARTALGRRRHRPKIEVRQGDLVHCAVPACDTAALLDVLHYLPEAAQEDLLRRVAAALAPGGVLLVREADADAGWRFAATQGGERLMSILRGHLLQDFHFRGHGEWTALLRAAGLAVDSLPMSEGTPYGNVLLIARKPDRLPGSGEPA